jgi:hypothetical protein
VTALYHDCQRRHTDLGKAVQTREAQEAARLQRAREAAATPAQH